MVRKYKRKTSRGNYGSAPLKLALDAVNNGLPVKTAATKFNVPRSTLRRHRDNKVQSPGSVQMGCFRPVLSHTFEAELVEKIKMMERSLFGLTSMDVRRLAYDLAVQLKVKSNFNADSKLAGKDWLNGFLTRHPDLSIRVPQATSISRAIGFNRPKVDAFYALYKSVLDGYAFTPQAVWNMDESGVTNVQKPIKVVATKGKRQVARMTSAERGITVTVVCCMNAAGQYVPPMLIFPRKRLAEGLMRGAPPGSIGEVSDSGWTDGELFVKWLKHFVATTNSSKSNPQILILDGHHSHKTLAAVDYSRDNGITIITLPPHCTHKLQPLDRTLFKSLKSHYNRVADNWMTSNAGKRITMFEIAELFGKAYNKVATIEKAVNGFDCCGLWPFEDAKFSDEDFAACELTDEPMPEPAMESAIVMPHLMTNMMPITETPCPSTSQTADGESVVMNSPSVNTFVDQHENSTSTSTLEASVSGELDIPVRVPVLPPHPGLEEARRILNELTPRPKIKQARARNRRTESSVIVTASPYKKILEENKKKKDAKKCGSKAKRKSVIQNGKASKKARCTGHRKSPNPPSSALPNSGEDNTPCCICSRRFNEPPVDDWKKCPQCCGWYHESCGPDDTDTCYQCL